MIIKLNICSICFCDSSSDIPSIFQYFLVSFYKVFIFCIPSATPIFGIELLVYVSVLPLNKKTKTKQNNPKNPQDPSKNPNIPWSLWKMKNKLCVNISFLNFSFNRQTGKRADWNNALYNSASGWMSPSCGKRNGEKGRKQKTTHLEMWNGSVGPVWEEGKDCRLLLLKGLRWDIQLWSPQPPPFVWLPWLVCFFWTLACA